MVFGRAKDEVKGFLGKAKGILKRNKSPNPLFGGKTSNVPKKTWKDVYGRFPSGGRKKDSSELEVGEGGRLKIHRPEFGAGAIVGIIILLGVIFFLWALFTDYEPVTSILRAMGIYQGFQVFKSQASYSLDYAGCITGNLGKFNPGDVTAGSNNFEGFLFGPIIEFCDQKLGTNADEIGCTECFDISVEAPNSRLVANRGQDAIIRATISAAETEFCYNNLIGEEACQPTIPAANPEIKITTKDGSYDIKLQGRCVGTNACNELDPNILPFTVIGRIKDSKQFCDVDAINVRGNLKYTYRTEGSAAITIRAAGSEEPFFSGRNPITLPGPVKVDIIPDSFLGTGTYEQGIDLDSFVFIRFRNQGEGTAKITKLELTQITPEGATALPEKCDGISGIELDSQAKSTSVLCTYNLEGVQLVGDSTTYIIIGEATYEYELERRAGSIVVDKSFCGEPRVTTDEDIFGGAGGDEISEEDIEILERA